MTIWRRLRPETWSRARFVVAMVLIAIITISFNLTVYGDIAHRTGWQMILAVGTWFIAAEVAVYIYDRWKLPERRARILKEIDATVEEAERRINTGEIPITIKDNDHD
jgi:uncharacterized sodium:solute symporter family permease YidK